MTSPEITIVDTVPYHLRDMAVAMQQESAAVAERMGMTPLKALWTSYRNALYCKSAFIDDKIAAIWGISGSILAETGRPFLIMTPEVEKYPMRVCFRYRKELNNMLKLFPILEEYVSTNNDKSIRLLELMQFKISRNKINIGGAEFRRAERRAV